MKKILTGFGLAASAPAFAGGEDNYCDDVITFQVCDDKNNDGLCNDDETRNTTAWEEVSKIMYGRVVDPLNSEDFLKRRELSERFFPTGDVYQCTLENSPESLKDYVRNSDTVWVKKIRNENDQIIGFEDVPLADIDNIHLDNIANISVPRKIIVSARPDLADKTYVTHDEMQAIINIVEQQINIYNTHIVNQNTRDANQDDRISKLEDNLCNQPPKPDCEKDNITPTPNPENQIPQTVIVDENEKKNRRVEGSLTGGAQLIHENGPEHTAALSGLGVWGAGYLHIPVDEKGNIVLEMRRSSRELKNLNGNG